MKRGSELLKNILFYSIMAIGFALFMIVVGEESPDSPMTLGEFFLWKFGALAGLYLLFMLGKRLFKAGLMASDLYDELNREEGK